MKSEEIIIEEPIELDEKYKTNEPLPNDPFADNLVFRVPFERLEKMSAKDYRSVMYMQFRDLMVEEKPSEFEAGLDTFIEQEICDQNADKNYHLDEIEELLQ